MLFRSNGVAPQNPVTLTYTIIDNAGCTFSTQFVTKVNSSITVTVPATNVCVNGTATVTPVITGGSGTYSTFSWTATGNATASGTASTFVVTGVTAGTANVVYSVVDNQTCPASGTVTGIITVNPLPTLVNASQTNVSCFGGSNGAVTFTGATSYTISPAAGAQATAGVFTGLTAGTYTVVGTSGFGCTSSTSVTITQPTQVVASVSITTPIACNGGMATLLISGSGGTPSYQVSGNNFTPSVVAGTYTYTITDANGCTASTSITVGQPPVLTATITVNSTVLCNGGNTGISEVTAGGGTAPYSYLWSSGDVTRLTTSGLIAGIYTVTVTDANSCTASTSVTIIQPPVLVPQIVSQVNVSCNGGSNGSATAFATGGTTPFSYSWSNGNTTATTTTGLTAGTYTVTVTDGNSCTASTTVTITQPTALLAGASQNTPPGRNGYGISCFGGNDGSATAAAFGGTPGYSYLWSNGETTVVAMMLSAGLKTVTVTDANGCTTTASVTMTQPPTPVSFSSTTFTSPTCAVGQGSSTNGTITVSATGGISPYTYAINPIATQGSPGAFSGLTTGTYTITVTDANSCTATTSVTVTAQNPIVATTSAVPPAICSGTTTTVSASGGATYAWTSAVTGQSATVSPATSSSSSFTPTITQPGSTVGTSTVTFTVTISSGVCSTTATTVVTVNPLPTLAGVTSPDPICSDAGAFNFTFTTNNNGANSLTIGNPSPSLSGFPQTLAFTSSPVGVVLPSPLTSNSYNLSYRVQNTITGCFSDADPSLLTSPVVVVNVRPRPVATVLAISGPAELCDAAPSSTLQVTTTGPNNSVVGAYPRNILIQGPAGTFTIIIPGTSDAAGTSSGTAAITVPGVYTVIGITDGTSCAGTITSGTATLRDGRFTVTPSANSNTTGYIGCSVAMTANEVFTTPAFSNGTLTRQWQFKTSAIAPYSDLIGETGATLTLTNLMLSQNGYIYRMKVIGTGACGGVDKYSGEVTLTVTNFPSASAGSNQTAPGATFTLAATLPLGTTGAWSVVSTNTTVTFASTTNPVTTVTLANPNTTATLRWTVSAPGGCSASSDVVITRANILLDAKVFLEGPLSGSTMSTSIRSFLPATSPYGTGETSTVILSNPVTDWIKIELRNSVTPSTVVEARSGLLLSNGKIVDMDGVSPLSFNVATAGTYHVAIIHRNHIDFRTNIALSFTAGSTTVVNFTIAAPNVFDTALKSIGGTTSAMFAGDGNGDNTVSPADAVLFRANFPSTLNAANFTTNTPAGRADYNLDGFVSPGDNIKYRTNFPTPTKGL